MSAIIYYLALPFIYLVSFLPFRVLYLLSDLMYLLIFRVFGYRKDVVTENLRNSFPDKSTAEIERIRSDFYHHLCDLGLETIKTLTISPAALQRRFKCEDYSAIKHFYDTNQSVIIVMGHMGNWEMGGNYFSLLPLHHLYVIYHPLRNKYFDRLFIKMRTRFGNGVYPMKTAYRGMVKNRDELTATTFVADQTPSPANAHWMTFLNQDTAVFKGTEAIARKMDYPIIYLSLIPEKRGLYTVHCELLIEHPRELSENEVTEIHTRRLERDIIKHPETWLWSHRRWKHQKPPNQANKN